KSLSETSSPFSFGRLKSGGLSFTSMNPTSARGLRFVSIYPKLLGGLAAMCLVLPAAAQTQLKKPRKSARAVAIIEWKKDLKGGLTPRLLPIALHWEGKYYDADVYQAAPRPMALEPGNIYEAMKSGVPAGLYTVRGGFEFKGVWYGVGSWAAGVTTSAK